MITQKPWGQRITTKSIAWVAARRDFAAGRRIDTYMLACLLGINTDTAAKHAKAGKFGAQMVGGRYEFDRELVAAEIGWTEEDTQ